jgi:hypothetical protein
VEIHGRSDGGPGRELVRPSPIHSKEVRPPCRGDLSQSERGERNREARGPAFRLAADARAKAGAVPGHVHADRGPAEPGRLDPRVEDGAERVDLELVIDVRRVMGREEDLEHVLLPEGIVAAALRRDDLVIAPYASMLAAPVAPKAALINLERPEIPTIVLDFQDDPPAEVPMIKALEMFRWRSSSRRSAAFISMVCSLSG